MGEMLSVLVARRLIVSGDASEGESETERSSGRAALAAWGARLRYNKCLCLYMRSALRYANTRSIISKFSWVSSRRSTPLMHSMQANIKSISV